MAYKDVEERSALPAFICRMDAKRRNSNNIDTYTPEQIKQAQRLYADVSNAYFRSRVFLNYRERFIAVKVEAPNYADKVSLEVRNLDKACEEAGYKKKATGKGSIVYRIERSA